MKRFFSTRVRVVLVVAVLLTIVLTVVSSLTNVRLPEMIVKGILTPLRTGASHLVDAAEHVYDYMFSYESLVAENEALREQMSQMEDAARQADSLARENEYLRKAMELKQSNPSWKLVDSYVISRGSQDWSSTFTVDRGTNAGIKAGMCAITANGELVGLVSEAGTNYAVVKSVLDSSLEISSTIASTGYNGMVKGGYSTGREGLLRMNYLPSSAVIRNNDQVVTSGSTIYPRNLIVGNVVDAGFDDSGLAKFALLKPAVDVGSLELLFIVTEYDPG